jgi:hypothetical protein
MFERANILSESSCRSKAAAIAVSADLGKRLLEAVLHAWLPSTMMETVYREGSWEQQKRQSRACRAANGRRLKSAESLN